MTSSSGESDAAWGQLAQAPEEERVRTITERFRSLAAMPEDERLNALRPLVRAEYALDEADLRAITLARLHTWLALTREEAQTMAASYEAVMREMSGQAAMRRVSLVQSLSIEFSGEDEDILRELLPNVFGAAPRRSVAAEAAAAASSAFSRQATTPQKKRPWWAFWQKA